MGHIVAHHIVETRGRLSLTRLVVIIIIMFNVGILRWLGVKGLHCHNILPGVDNTMSNKMRFYALHDSTAL